MRSLDNPELFTEQEKAENKESAFGSDAAYNAVYAAYAAANAVTNATVEYWVNKFFERTGEDKQVYIDEVERLKEDEIMNKLKAGDKVKFSVKAKMLQGLDPYGIYTVAKTERSFVYLDILDSEQGCW